MSMSKTILITGANSDAFIDTSKEADEPLPF
jgi:hypothetical protein